MNAWFTKLMKYYYWLFLLIIFLLITHSGSLMERWHNSVSALTIAAVLFGKTSLDIDFVENSQSLAGVEARSLAKLEPSQAEAWLLPAADGLGLDDMLTAFELCRLYWENGRGQEAITSCRKIQDIGHYWLNLGLSAEQPELAIAYYKMATESDPEFAEPWYRLGRELVLQEEYSAAISALEQAYALDFAQTVDKYVLLGRSYAATGQVEKGRAFLQEGIELNPESRGLYIDLVETYRIEEEWDIVEMWYGRYLEKWPEDGRAWSRRGEAAFNQKKWTEAVAYLQTAVQYRPNSLGDWSRLAQASVENGDTGLASQAYDKMLELAPENVNLWLEAGKFYTNEAQIERARQIYMHILEVTPNSEEAQVQLDKLNEE